MIIKLKKLKEKNFLQNVSRVFLKLSEYLRIFFTIRFNNMQGELHNRWILRIEYDARKERVMLSKD
jgi:hypothetical protein